MRHASPSTGSSVSRSTRLPPMCRALGEGLRIGQTSWHLPPETKTNKPNWSCGTRRRQNTAGPPPRRDRVIRTAFQPCERAPLAPDRRPLSAAISRRRDPRTSRRCRYFFDKRASRPGNHEPITKPGTLRRIKRSRIVAHAPRYDVTSHHAVQRIASEGSHWSASACWL